MSDTGIDRSTNPTVVEYAVQDLFKGKSPAAAANRTAKKFSGGENMFFGPGVTLIDPRVLEAALWDRLAEHSAKAISKYDGDAEGWLGGTLQHFGQTAFGQPSKTAQIEKLKALVVAKMGRDPFTMRESRRVGETMGFKYTVREVTDFKTLPEIVTHAQREGATHVIVNSIGNAWIYFPIAGGKYGECRAVKQNGRWHVDGPGHRDVVDRIQRSATPIEKYLARVGGGRATEQRNVRDNAGQGMHVGWMEVYVYAADLYCEDCGRSLQEGKEDTGDSNDYPQGPYPDGGGESDGPQHCGALGQCLNAMEFAGSKVGVWLGNPLTDDGVEALKEILSNPSPTAYQLALHEFWSDVYSDYLEGWEPPAPEMPSPQLPLPGVRERSGHSVMARSAKDPRGISGAEINKELDRLDKTDHVINDEMIAAGRGHERASETYALGMGHDPLTDRYIENGNRRQALRIEMELRYGPGTPRRLPRGFGPRGNFEARASVRSPVVRDFEGMSYEEWLQTARSHNDAHIHDNSVARLAYSRGVDPEEFVELYGGFALEEGRIAKRFRIGSIVTMNADALENYGTKWSGISLKVTHVATSHADHPGFDPGGGSALYDLEVATTRTPLPMSLYDWELEPAPKGKKQ